MSVFLLRAAFAVNAHEVKVALFRRQVLLERGGVGVGGHFHLNFEFILSVFSLNLLLGCLVYMQRRLVIVS